MNVLWASHEGSANHRGVLPGLFTFVILGLMANESGSVYCFGCGITSRPADRRALDTPGSEHVVEVWKAFAEDEEEFEELLSESSAKMCRKCFSAYDRYSKLHDTIKENFKRAAEVLRRAPSSSGAQPLPKRPRLGSTRLHMTPRELPSAGEKSRTGSDGTTQSPEVAVSVSIMLS